MKNLDYTIIPFMRGTDGDASVVFVNTTFQVVNETEKRYPDPDFGAWLIDEIYNKKKIFAERKGLFKKRFFCAACGTEINLEKLSPKQIEYEIKYKHFNSFRLQISIPSVICPRCTRICGIDLDGSLTFHLNESILHAFKSNSIKRVLHPSN